MNLENARLAEDQFPPPNPFDMHDLSRYRNLARYVKHKPTRCARFPWRPVVCSVALLLFIGALWVSFGSPSAQGVVSRSGSEAPVSTPAYLWVKGEVPYLYQTDKQWADQAYAEGTVGTDGCGPVCLAMVYVSVTGKRDMDPAQMAQFSERNGFASAEGTEWALMSRGARQLGLRSYELSPRVGIVADYVRKGCPVIGVVGPGDFTTVGHFIVISGIDGDGKFIVHDPNSAERSQMRWDAEQVLNQCLNLWAFE